MLIRRPYIGLLGLIALMMFSACSSAAPAPPTASPAPPTTDARTVLPSAVAQASPTSAPTPVPPPTAAPMPTAAPTNVAPAVLSGSRAILRGAVTQRLFVVMIDNHPNAYPQSGLNAAGMVIESLAEFGITRYLTVFSPESSPDVEEIGPVRSTRSYFVEWAKGLRAVYAHAGGSPEGLLLAETALEIENLDALHNGTTAYFWRSKNRVAPHNLYTNIERLQQAATDRQATDFDGSELGFLFKDDVPVAQRPATQRIDYSFLSTSDMVGWVYDPDTNGYYRLRRGRPHVDAGTGEQIWFKNVVVMQINEEPLQNDAKGRIEQQVIGEGVARVFVDGVMREATWRKAAGFAPLRFFDASGQEVRFNTGPVWIAAIPAMDRLTVDGN